jgi:hypothetical protein
MTQHTIYSVVLGLLPTFFVVKQKGIRCKSGAVIRNEHPGKHTGCLVTGNGGQ